MSNINSSDCCQAEIISVSESIIPAFDQCFKCKRGIQYAYIGYCYPTEGFGVFQAFNGDYYFFWASVHRQDLLKEALQRGFKYLAQVQNFVTSPSAYYKRDQDRLTRDQILYVLEPWVDKVKNPEVMSKFRQT